MRLWVGVGCLDDDLIPVVSSSYLPLPLVASLLTRTGKGTFNPPLKVSVAGSAIVQAISDSTISGVVTSSQLDSMAPQSSKKSPDQIDILTSGIASISRLPYGTTVAPSITSNGVPPNRPPSSSIQIYQFEGCPFCRRVREVCTYLDLSYTVVPCGRGSRHRKQVENAAKLMGRRATYPFMEDVEGGVQMFESEDIINYLIDKYGGDVKGLPGEYQGRLAPKARGIWGVKGEN